MSGLDIYFDKPKLILGTKWLQKYRDFVFLFFGFLMGVFLMMFIYYTRKVVKQRKAKKKTLLGILKKKQKKNR